MKFWDSSAVISLCVSEPTSAAMGALLRDDPAMVAWWSTRIECVSGLLRRSREGSLSAAGVAQARAVLRALTASWVEVATSESVRTIAARVLAAHALRVADSLQLAAALIWCDEDPQGTDLVSYDARLREAAIREGFGVLPRST